MSVLELHAFPASSPSRALHMTLDLLGLEYKYVPVNILVGEQLAPEFLALNPQHTVPTLVDGNLTVTESRAAMAYLVSQHKPGQLYPACAKKRSQIDQRLQFNMSTLWRRIGDCVFPVCFGKTSTIPEEKMAALKEALMWTNQMLGGGHVVGNSMTLADIDFMASYASLEACAFISLEPYKALKVWAQAMRQKIPKYADNCGKGATVFGNWFNGNYKPATKQG